MIKAVWRLESKRPNREANNYWLNSSMLERLNQAASSSFMAPDRTLPGYRLWFRGYIPSQLNLNLVGVALAWPEVGSKYSKTYYCVAGGACELYTKDSGFDPTTTITYHNSPKELMGAKFEALNRLEVLVKQELGI